jgi:hypothetical protein
MIFLKAEGQTNDGGNAQVDLDAGDRAFTVADQRIGPSTEEFG